MPFDSSGQFNRLRNWVSDAAAGIKIRADYHDSEDDGFAQGLSQCITKDGKTQPTANIPMNGKRIINLGSPGAPTDAANKAYVDSVKEYPQGATITGTDANGMLTFSATTGKTGLSFTGADLSWVARIAADPVNWPNRLALMSGPNGTGTELFSIDDTGRLFQSTLHLDGNAFHDGTGWRVSAAGYPNIMTGSISDGAFRWYTAAATTAAGQVATIQQAMGLDRDGNLSILKNFSTSGRADVTSTVQSNNGRLISHDAAVNAQPSVTVWSGNRSYAAAMFLTTTNRLAFGAAGGDGSPASTFFSASTTDLTTTGFLSSGGAVYAATDVNANGNVTAGGNLYAAAGQAGLFTGGSGRVLQFAPAWYFDWTSTTGELNWRASTGHWHSFKTDGAFWISGSTGAKTVAGQWASWSDARIKTVLGDYAPGLAAVLAIRPRRFKFKPGETGGEEPDEREYVGLVAQEVEAVLPDTVRKMKGKIGGEDVDDKRLFDPTNIMYALVNAVKELSAKLDEANAKIAALEAK